MRARADLSAHAAFGAVVRNAGGSRGSFGLDDGEAMPLN
jgi:hypothetical protein